MNTEKLQELVQLRRAIRIRPKYATDQAIHGFPLVVSEQFILIHEINDFHLDGYTVIPLRNLYAVRSGKAERMIERVFTGEGAFDKITVPEEVRLDSFRDLFRSIQKLGKLVIVDSVEVDGETMEEDSFIGKIVGMSPRSVAILNFNGAGEWETEPTVVSYKQIKWVTFDNEYVNTFAKYLP